jgi:hypothetical protein
VNRAPFISRPLKEQVLDDPEDKKTGSSIQALLVDNVIDISIFKLLKGLQEFFYFQFTYEVLIINP